MDIRISVSGEDPVAGLEELASWLGMEPEFRGRIRPLATAPAPGELGAVTDVLIAALGTGGTASVLASSLRAFLAQPRRSDVRITVEAPDGSRVEVDAKRVADVENLVRQALSLDPPAN